MSRTFPRFNLRAALVPVLAAFAIGAGCTAEPAQTPEEEYGNRSISVILDQADRLEHQQVELSAMADMLADQAQAFRQEADDFHRKEEELRTRAEELEARATDVRTMLDDRAGTLAGMRNAATTLRAVLSDEPVQIPPTEAVPARGRLVLYAVLIVVLVLVLMRLRRRRVEREEEERLNAIRRQQAAYSPTAPNAPPAAAAPADEVEKADTASGESTPEAGTEAEGADSEQ